MQLGRFDPHLHIWPPGPSVPTWNWHSARTSEAPGRCEPATQWDSDTHAVSKDAAAAGVHAAAEEAFLGGGRGLFSTLQTIMARWEQEGVGFANTAQRVPQFAEESYVSCQGNNCQKASRHHQVTTAQPIREASGRQSDPPLSLDYVRQRNSKQFLVSGRMINTGF